MMREKPNMLRGTAGLAIAMSSLMLLVSFDASALRFYQSIDENGEVVFSDRPTNASSEQIDVKVFTPDVPAPAVPGAQRAGKDAAQKGDAKNTQNAQKDLKALQAMRAENCTKATSYLGKLQTVSRLYSEDEKGVRTYVSDEARVQQLADARASVSDWCK
ncbi:MAG: DUF4124 domain-containing protein [Thiotrichaceae bacterium]|nr:DUF4124 domain-containing protein [Thiotrichaceae bacterium]PCI13274.1 MAG: hypothetical protein COB71_06605 [Thiotrichales bacterium]